MYSTCPCISNGACSMKDSGWSSVSVDSVVLTAPDQVSITNPQIQPVVAGSTATHNEFGAYPLATEGKGEKCQDSYKDLLKTFQSKCNMTAQTRYNRFIALIALASMLGFSALVFGAAHLVDHLEISKFNAPAVTPA